MFKKFNINNTIKVKLKDEGYQIMADEHNRFIPVIKNWQYRDLNYYKEAADSDGYTTFQAWCFIELFGQYTGIGFNTPYHPTILIDEIYIETNE